MIRDEAFDSFTELNLIEQFGIAALHALPIKNEPCLPFSRDIASGKAEIGETNFRRIVVRCMTPQRTKQVIIATTIAVTGIIFLVSWFGGDPFDWSKQPTKTRWEMLGGFSVAAAVAFVCHWFIRRWFVACIVCT